MKIRTRGKAPHQVLLLWTWDSLQHHGLRARETNEMDTITVLGSGPAGLGVAFVLKDDCVLLERGPEIGGLSRSIEIDGAVFDLGGHCFHTPHREVRELVFGSIDMYEQPRDARCFVQGELIPYPFQKNFHKISDTAVVNACSEGLAAARMANDERGNAENFHNFLFARFGDGIAKHFMLPYNKKLWGRDLRRLAVDWTGERVAAPDGVNEQFDTSYGRRKPLQADTRVAYPSKGGFGEIYKSLARGLTNVRLNETVVSIDAKEKKLYTKCGKMLSWHKLVSTIPLDILVNMIDPVPNTLIEKVSQLECLSLKLGLVVIDHPVDTEMQRVYSAEEHIPGHKIAMTHNSSDYLRGLPRHGVTVEISVGPEKVFPRNDLREWIVESLIDIGLLSEAGEVRRVDIRDVKYAYPVPTPNRASIVSEIRTWLESKDIYTVGRFGEWSYINSDEAIYRGIQLGKKLAGL